MKKLIDSRHLTHLKRHLDNLRGIASAERHGIKTTKQRCDAVGKILGKIEYLIFDMEERVSSRKEDLRDGKPVPGF